MELESKVRPKPRPSSKTRIKISEKCKFWEKNVNEPGINCWLTPGSRPGY
jgi:hypothetical protein